MNVAALASRTFGAQDQNSFARLSGDFNPIHMDPLAARKTSAGLPIVHGIHGVLWALDQLVEARVVTSVPASLKVRFARFIFVGSTVELRLVHRDERSVRADITLGGLTATTLILTHGVPRKTEKTARLASSVRTPVPDEPAAWSDLAQLTELSGRMDIAGPLERVDEEFPNLVSVFGVERAAAIALLSRLVGMICPGLHSLFAAFALEFVESLHHEAGVEFLVSKTDPRFRLIQMNISGCGVLGSVDAFLRWAPINQSSLIDIMKIVAPGEFAGSTALIIGGSRGLGALTAKLIAAGSGKVIITYATGKADATQLMEEIHGEVGQGVCRVLPYDARKVPGDQLGTLAEEVSHLYYFATPPIYRQKEALFVSALFDEFIQVYVKGFYDCCHALAGRGFRGLTAFYPSSVFVEQNPLTLAEYSMAKLAGESLCSAMNRAADGIRVIVERLPRLLTDQTATVPPVRNGDPLEVMLPIIRNVQMAGTLSKSPEELGRANSGAACPTSDTPPSPSNGKASSTIRIGDAV
jgi:acyl dehydratase/NAD(P)-dependent dehydrogenase (short-subunit alcohol dehydrogenase family)